MLQKWLGGTPKSTLLGAAWLQTDVYLEELTDVVPETDNTTQTDAFLERPPTPQFVPAKSGVDVATQIEDGEHAVLQHACLSLQYTVNECSAGAMTASQAGMQHSLCRLRHAGAVFAS